MQACASQDIGNGATVDPKQVAVISADSQLSTWLPGLAVVMKEIDGVAVGSSTHRLTVPQGVHNLTVECTNGPASNTQFLEIDARAGQRYQLAPAVDSTAYPCKAVMEAK